MLALKVTVTLTLNLVTSKSIYQNSK